MTTVEREAFDALLKYAQMSDDICKLNGQEWLCKYAQSSDELIPDVLNRHCHFALEKAREVSE